MCGKKNHVTDGRVFLVKNSNENTRARSGLGVRERGGEVCVVESQSDIGEAAV